MHQGQSEPGRGWSLAAPLHSPFSPPRSVTVCPPPHRQGNGRTGTCPGIPGPGPLVGSETENRNAC